MSDFDHQTETEDLLHVTTPAPLQADTKSGPADERLLRYEDEKCKAHQWTKCPDPDIENSSDVALRAIGITSYMYPGTTNPVVYTAPARNKGKTAPFTATLPMDLSKVATADPRFASVADVMTASITLSIHADKSVTASMSYHFTDKAAEAKFKHSVGFWTNIKEHIWASFYFDKAWEQKQP